MHRRQMIAHACPSTLYSNGVLGEVGMFTSDVGQKPGWLVLTQER